MPRVCYRRKGFCRRVLIVYTNGTAPGEPVRFDKNRTKRWLAGQDKRLRVDRLQHAPGRVNRGKILAEELANEEKSHAEERFAEDLQELMGMDVFLLDPVRGVAFIPFQKDTELAWFVYDHF